MERGELMFIAYVARKPYAVVELNLPFRTEEMLVVTDDREECASCDSPTPEIEG